MSIPVRIGLVGAGRWAEVHRRALAGSGAQLAGVLVRSAETRERVVADWRVEVTTEADTFFSWDFDAAIIASPNYLHAEHAVAALKAGKHVLIEKPMATTLADCDRILAAARAAGKVVAVGLEMRVFTLFERVKKLIDAGEIGAPLHLKLDLSRRPYRSGAGGWKTDPQKLGSPVLEEPIHYLDLARWYLGDPRELQAWANSRPGRESLWENLDVRLEFPGGARALITRSIAAYQHHLDLILIGENGALRATWDGLMDADPEPEVALTLHNDRGTTPLEISRHTGHAHDVPRQTRAFLAAIRQGTQPIVSARDGRVAVALCLAVEESLRSGSRVIELGV